MAQKRMTKRGTPAKAINSSERSSLLQLGASRLGCDLHQQAISESPESLYIARILRIILQAGTRLGHGLVETVIEIALRLSRPERAYQLGTRNQIPVGLDWHAKDRFGLMFKAQPYPMPG